MLFVFGGSDAVAQSLFCDMKSWNCQPRRHLLAQAELLAKDLSGSERDDIQTVADQIIRLRALSERLLVITTAEDPPSGSVSPRSWP